MNITEHELVEKVLEVKRQFEVNTFTLNSQPQQFNIVISKDMNFGLVKNLLTEYGIQAEFRENGSQDKLKGVFSWNGKDEE